jgi:hypothetical protein
MTAARGGPGSEFAVDVARDGDTCYRLLCAVERVAEWVPGVANVRIVERDAAGRPSLVHFVGMPARGSLTYALRYGYDDAARAVSWRSEDTQERDLEGEARVEPLDDGRCRLHYRLRVWAADTLPVWARSVLQEESAEPVAAAFRRWAERAR